MKWYVKAALVVIAVFVVLPASCADALLSLLESHAPAARVVVWCADFIFVFAGALCLAAFTPGVAAIAVVVLIILGCLRSLPFLGMNAGKLNLLICMMVFSLNCSYLIVALHRIREALPHHVH